MHRNDESQRASNSTDQLTQESPRVSDCHDLHGFQTALINIGITDGQIVLTNIRITVLFQTVLINIGITDGQIVLTNMRITVLFQTVLTNIGITDGQIALTNIRITVLFSDCPD